MALTSRPPHHVGTEVPHAEPDNPEPLPLTDVDQFVPQQIRRLCAMADNHQGTQGDACGTARHRPTDPQPVSIAAFDRHSSMLTRHDGTTARQHGSTAARQLSRGSTSEQLGGELLAVPSGAHIVRTHQFEHIDVLLPRDFVELDAWQQQR